MRNPHAGVPFTAEEFSDEQIAAALKDVSIPTLLLSCVHMTDDPAVRESILTGDSGRRACSSTRSRAT